MRVTVSIPDDVYQQAEQLARRLNVPRSRLYRLALSDYLARFDSDAVTTAMNETCADLGGGSDPFVSAAARRTLERCPW